MTHHIYALIKRYYGPSQRQRGQRLSDSQILRNLSNKTTVYTEFLLMILMIIFHLYIYSIKVYLSNIVQIGYNETILVIKNSFK